MFSSFSSISGCDNKSLTTSKWPNADAKIKGVSLIDQIQLHHRFKTVIS